MERKLLSKFFWTTCACKRKIYKFINDQIPCEARW